MYDVIYLLITTCYPNTLSSILIEPTRAQCRHHTCPQKRGNIFILSNFYLDLDQAPLGLGKFYPDN